MQSPDHNHPIFLPGKILQRLSSDAQRGIVDGFNAPFRNDDRPEVETPRAALGWYGNHFTDLESLGERIVGADRGSPSGRYAGAMNEMRSISLMENRRPEPLVLNYGEPSGDEMGSGNPLFGR